MDDCGQTEQQLVWFGCGTEALMPHITDEQIRVEMTREEDLSFLHEVCSECETHSLDVFTPG